jgi:hypothetical protein
MIEFIVVVFLYFPTGQLKIVGDNPVKTQEECLAQVAKINGDKQIEFNAFCIVKENKDKV